MIPDDEVERVRDVGDIVGIIGEFTPLKRVGTGFRGACPFHQGKNPNFSVDPKRRIYHCFKCGESGDVFTFLRKRLGVDWPSAVRMVAEKSGITLREVSSRREGPDPREPLWEVNAAAEDFFHRMLRDERPAPRAPTWRSATSPESPTASVSVLAARCRAARAPDDARVRRCPAAGSGPARATRGIR